MREIQHLSQTQQSAKNVYWLISMTKNVQMSVRSIKMPFRIVSAQQLRNSKR